jgi:SAM-dependent methyltransferase
VPGERLDDVMRRVIAHDRKGVVLEYQKIARSLAGSGPVLDLGCGTGTLLETLQAMGTPAHGVDASPLAVEACRQRGLTAAQGDIFECLRETASESYGAVFAGHLVEHLRPEDAERLYAEAWRILRPSGRLVVLTPNPRNLSVAGEAFWIDPTHVRPYPRQLLRALALKAGFSEVKVVRWWGLVTTLQMVAALVRWVATAGLHDPAPALLAIAMK